MDADLEKRAQLAEITAVCTKAGFINGTDFAVWYNTEFVGTDFIQLGLDGEDFVIWHYERGYRIEFGRSASADEAQRIFLDKVAEFAGYRGRGPRAGQRRRRAERLTPDEIIADFRRRRGLPEKPADE